MQQSFQLYSNCGLHIYKLRLEKYSELFFYHSNQNSLFSLFFQTKNPLTVELNNVHYRNLELGFVCLFLTATMFLYFFINRVNFGTISTKKPGKGQGLSTQHCLNPNLSQEQDLECTLLCCREKLQMLLCALYHYFLPFYRSHCNCWEFNFCTPTFHNAKSCKYSFLDGKINIHLTTQGLFLPLSVAF